MNLTEPEVLAESEIASILTPVECHRHTAYTIRGEHGFCDACFEEAVAFAEAQELDAVIEVLREPLDQQSAAWLLARLGWRA